MTWKKLIQKASTLSEAQLNQKVMLLCLKSCHSYFPNDIIADWSMYVDDQLL